MNQQLETYGERSWVDKKVKYFTIYNDERYANFLNERGFKIYRPKVNKAKASVAGVLVAGCLITPFTNLFIPSIIRWSLK